MKKIILLFFTILLFASCEQEIAHSEEDGVLSGLFSVSETEQIRFSQGNLQYQASTNTWRFAENQYDVIGTDNSNISDSYDGWIDLFGWATSGYSNSMPYQTSDDVSDYGPEDESIGGTNYDWGVFNKILNGGNTIGLWRLLAKDEWEYILNKRDNASKLFGVGCVNGVNGLILLPDSCVIPEGVTFRAAVASDSGAELYRIVNDFDIAEWTLLEEVGAVFFPAAGARLGSRVMYTGTAGYYWTETTFEYDAKSIYCMGFDSSRAVWEGLSNRTNGRSVRLVK
jgi:hypothetical protein